MRVAWRPSGWNAEGYLPRQAVCRAGACGLLLPDVGLSTIIPLRGSGPRGGRIRQSKGFEALAGKVLGLAVDSIVLNGQ